MVANESQGSPGTRSTREAQSQWVDCIQASEMCSQDSRCSPRYRVMRQCLVGKEKDAMLDNNRDCKAALEVLHNSSLYDCRCKRAMKNELQCLQNYWTIHMGLNEDMEDSSPYEPVAPNRQPDVFGLASISSAEKDCNPCLNATKACNLNSLCKRHRSSYITTCSRSDTNRGESCNRKRCHKTLRAFMDRVPPELSQRLIFCPCQSEGCAERRRQTIVPDCSYTDKEKPNCLELRRVCRADALCRSRLADYIANCWMAPNTVGTCPNQDNHQACLNSLARLIGTEMTPNYVDNSFTNWTISPWCNCIGSGNQEEECMNFLRYFTDNTCLTRPCWKNVVIKKGMKRNSSSKTQIICTSNTKHTGKRNRGVSFKYPCAFFTPSLLWHSELCHQPYQDTIAFNMFHCVDNAFRPFQ
uniref:GDNF family receptor alpha 2 n=1 Tax=Poecilia latipinna TaxID=48699 RepID=A0A3B3U8M2_9TELE